MPPNRRAAMMIWSAMVIGLVVFAGVAVVAHGVAGFPTSGAPAESQPLILISAGFAVISSAVALLLPSRLPGPPGATPEARAFSRLLVACAMAEGGCLFCLVTVLLYADPRSELVALLPFAVLVSRFPSQERWEILGAPPETSG